MIGIRHENYFNSMDGLPFYAGIDIERTPYTLSKEQNWHKNPEIQVFTEGSGSVLLDGRRYEVQKGNIVFVNPNIMHYTFTDSRLVYTCLIISPEWCRQLEIDPDTMQFEPLIENPELNKLIFSLTQIYNNKEDNLRKAKLIEIFARIMIELVGNHSNFVSDISAGSKSTETVATAIEYIHSNFQNKITLSDIAKSVLFDKYALCREFKKYTGQTIFGYINHYRCVKATDFLMQNYTVSETANLCGFENLSFFTKTFKRHIGQTPSQYKK